MIRRQNTDEAIKFLQRAAGINSNNAHYIYVYAVALNSAGKNDLAIEVLQDANNRFPQDTNILEALIAFHRDAGNDFEAQTLLRKRQKLK
jgi:Flp pilus assembly protein TadD